MQSSLKAVVTSVILCLSARVAEAQNERYLTQIDTVVTLSSQGTVDVSLLSGKVNIIGGSGSRVRVRAVSGGDNVLEFDASSTRVRLRVEHHGGAGARYRPRGRRNEGAEFDITVPEGTRVVVEAISAPVSVKGVKGEVKVETVSGSITVADASRKVAVESVSGSLDIARVVGDVRAETVSGHLAMAAVSGEIVGETVSGQIRITEARSRSVRAESVSGRVSYGGSFDPAGSYDFSSHSGSLTLSLPANAGARVRLETFSGNVDSDFPVTFGANQSRPSNDSKFEFTIGNGRSRVAAETFSGNIRIQRGASRNQPE